MAKTTKIIKKPGERDITSDALTNHVLPKSSRVSQTPSEQPPGDFVSGDKSLDVERRKGERRQDEQRRSGLRGQWEERRVLDRRKRECSTAASASARPPQARVLDRRKREYSIFGKRLDGAETETAPNPPSSPDVPLEVLISPSEIRILEEQERKAQEQAARKAASKAGKRRKKTSE